MRKIGIFGAGGFGREVAWLCSRLPDIKVEAFVTDDPAADSIHEIPVYSFAAFCERNSYGRKPVVSIAIGNPAARERVATRCAEAYCEFQTIEDPTVLRSASVEVGEGSIICAHTILTVDIKLGRHVHINLDCTIGHDVVMEDFATLAPGVHISGNVHIERGVYIGTGASIINGHEGTPLVIGAGSVIGAGACVTKSCEPKALYAGVPAVLKKQY
jgi:sugar O-acyltransferase (sialic acid O-acetyltransferase NeuD family)